MRKSLLLLAVMPVIASAQSWCPPGATWKTTIGPSLSSGQLTRAYAGDTVLGGLAAQRIETTGYQVYNQDTIELQYSNYTSTQGQTVFLWVQSFFLPTPQWDTLLRYDAQIGDHWFPPGSDFYCSQSSIQGSLQVQDTGHIVVDGHTIKYWEVAYLDFFGMPEFNTGRYYERLGYMGGLVPLGGSCVIADYGEIINCYTDVDLSYLNAQYPGECDISLSTLTSRDQPTHLPFPNPGLDHFFVDLPSAGMHTIEVWDAMGRCVLRVRRTDGQARIDTGTLDRGVYTVQVTDNQGAFGSSIWLKE